ncbi:MAG: PD-(D/E)XK nuclease family protein [Janthinobacterium lividum]
MFNIFKALEKDDKELIHSSFLSFLLSENGILYRDFFGISEIEFEKPVLEKTYLLKLDNKKNVKRRIDIEAVSVDGKSVLVIENKFKSFPYKQQLIDYDIIYESYHSGKIKYRFLFCFDKALIDFKSDWVVFDYQDLLSFIKNNYFQIEDDAKLLFIKHYYDFLKEYYEHYKQLVHNGEAMFMNSFNSEYKFWLRLFYSALRLELTKYFEKLGKEVRFDIDGGATKVPLLNIIPNGWKIDGKELLIQFQGNELKFYSHSGDRYFIEKVVAIAKNYIHYNGIEFKKMTRKNSATYYILKIKLLYLMTDKAIYNIDTIKSVIIKFYNDIDARVINQLLMR